MVRIELRDVHVRRGDVSVLRGIDLAIDSGGAVAVLGASGSGKTTLLRTIIGLEQPHRGRILLDGEDVTGTPTAERDLAMVAQGAPLQDHLSVGGNVAFPLRLRAVESDERDRRVDTELQAFGLSEMAGRKPRSLSDGERHAAAAAHSTVRVPRGLLLDEPVGALDPDSRRDVLAQVRAVHQGSGATLVVATNDRAVAALGDRVVVIDEGRVLQVAPLHVLHDEPDTLVVADLTGTWPVNRLAAHTGRLHDGRVALDTAAGRLTVWRDDLADVAQVMLAIRPSELAAGPDEPGTTGLRGTVTDLAPLGHLWQVSTQVDGLQVVAVARDDPPAVGQVVGLHPRRVHVFGLDGSVMAHVDLHGTS